MNLEAQIYITRLIIDSHTNYLRTNLDLYPLVGQLIAQGLEQYDSLRLSLSVGKALKLIRKIEDGKQLLSIQEVDHLIHELAFFINFRAMQSYRNMKIRLKNDKNHQEYFEIIQISDFSPFEAVLSGYLYLSELGSNIGPVEIDRIRKELGLQRIDFPDRKIRQQTYKEYNRILSTKPKSFVELFIWKKRFNRFLSNHLDLAIPMDVITSDDQIKNEHSMFVLLETLTLLIRIRSVTILIEAESKFLKTLNRRRFLAVISHKLKQILKF